MADTVINGIPLMGAAQNQKYLTSNAAISYLDGLVNLTVFNRVQNVPPSSPSEGDRYVVGSGGSGIFSGEDGRLAMFLGSDWVFFSPSAGWRAFDQGAGEIIVYDGSEWVELASFLGLAAQNSSPGVVSTGLGTSSNSAKMSFVQEEEELVLDGAAIVSSNLFFPNRSIPLFASVYNISEITGPSGFQWYVYEFGEAAIQFESGFSGNGAANQQQSGPANPVKPVFSDATVDFEDMSSSSGLGNGAQFTGGSVRLTIGYFLSQPASS